MFLTMLPAGASVWQLNCVHNWFPPQKYRAQSAVHRWLGLWGEEGVTGSDCVRSRKGRVRALMGRVREGVGKGSEGGE